MRTVKIDVFCMIGRLFEGASAANPQVKEEPLQALPAIIFDSGNVQYMKLGYYGDHVEYAADGGKTLTICHAGISGSSALTNAGAV